MRWAFGIDIGGTKIEIACIGENGKILERKKIQTHVEAGPLAIIQEIVDVVQELQDQSKGQANAVGIGMAGQIAIGSGIVKYAPNLNWENVPLQSTLSDQLNLPVVVTNDVRAATWGEWIHGAGQGSDNIVCLFIGTGIGGGVVANGQIVAGNNNSAGELGHTVIQINGPACSCGNKGCLEAFAGGWALTRHAREIVKNNPQEAAQLLGQVKDNEELTSYHIIQSAKMGDLLAQKILAEAIEAITIGCSNFLNAFNPEKLIIGGGLGLALPDLIEKITLGVKQKALKSATENLQVLYASLHTDAGVVGAATLALKMY